MNLAEILAKKKPIAASVVVNYYTLRELKKYVLALTKTNIDFLVFNFQNNNSLAVSIYEDLRFHDLGLHEFIEFLRSIQKKLPIPFIFAVTTADILAYGIKPFFNDLKSTGVEALLIEDLPPEEGRDFIFLCKQLQLPLIFSAANNSSSDRLPLLAELAQPFLRIVVNKKYLSSKKEDYFAKLKGLTEQLKSHSTKSIILECVDLPLEALPRLFNFTDGIIFKDRMVSADKRAIGAAIKKIKRIVKEIDKK